MSEVDLARRSVDDAGYVRFLVVKRIRANHLEDQAFVRMFKDEARITSELRHTNIAQVYDFGRVGDEYYLALEYVPGVDLRGLLSTLRSQRKRMPVRMALKVASDTLDALHYAHTRTDTMGRPMEVVHRDVNPRNVMVSVSGEVKLIDFGVARATDRLERTQTDHFKGKVAYMAPEQVASTDNLDHRVDIFAMGLTLYEMLTGRSAFAGLDQTQILFRIMNGNLPQLEEPREWGAPGRALCQLVDRALAHQADDRFPTARDMRDAVQRVAADFGGLPTQAEVAAWLREVDPGLEDRIRDKMRRLSGELPAEGSTPGGPGALTPPDEASATLEKPAVPGQDAAGSRTLTAPVVVAAGLGTATLVGIILVTGIILVGGIIAGAAWLPGSASGSAGGASEAGLTEQDPSADPDADVDADTEPQDVKPLEIWPPPYKPDVEQVRPAGASSVRPAGATEPGDASAGDGSGGSDAGGGDEASDGEGEGSDAAGEGAGEGTPDGGDASTPAEGEGETASTTASTEPSSASTPERTEPVAMGRLQVTAATKGVPILIDGEPSGHTTGQQFPWPAGRHTISAEGLAPVTVEVRPGLVAFVPLKPR